MLLPERGPLPQTSQTCAIAYSRRFPMCGAKLLLYKSARISGNRSRITAGEDSVVFPRDYATGEFMQVFLHFVLHFPVLGLESVPRLCRGEGSRRVAQGARCLDRGLRTICPLDKRLDS